MSWKGKVAIHSGKCLQFWLLHAIFSRFWRHSLIFAFVMLLSRVLENITGYIINIDDINYYKDEEGNYDYDRYFKFVTIKKRAGMATNWNCCKNKSVTTKWSFTWNCISELVVLANLERLWWKSHKRKTKKIEFKNGENPKQTSLLRKVCPP